VFGLSAGIAAARRPGGALDRFLTIIGSSLIALPGFWAGMMLSTWFGVELGWLPSGGYVPFSESPSLWAASLVLPCIALSLTPAASVARQMRVSMIANLDSDYVRTARAKGVSESAIIRRHALRNSLGPVATVIGFQVATMIGGSFVIEVIFSLPGLGGLTVPAVLASDTPVIMAVIMVVAVAVLITNLIVDLLYNYFDPRVREQ
jgi:peptide/nickel transport system permease protein